MDRNTIADTIERWEPGMKPRRRGRPLHATDVSGTLTGRTPTLRERLADFLARNIGEGDTREGVRKMSRATNLDPLTSLYQAGRAGAEGSLGEAAFEGASSAPGFGKIAGGLGKAMFLGVGAKMADRQMLDKAKDLLSKGNSPESIFKETGWFKGADDKWRFEISDEPAEFLGFGPPPGGKRPMEDVLSHEELYRNYPQLQRMDVEIAAADPGLQGGYSQPDTPLVPGQPPGQMFLNVWGHDPLDTLLHEGQHAIQDIEGFAMGGSPPRGIIKPGDPAWPFVLKRRKDMEQMMRNQPSVRALSPEEREQAIMERAAQDYYERFIGETEARQVAQRRGYDTSVRQLLPPTQMEYPAAEQILTQYGRGTGPVVDPNQPNLPFSPPLRRTP